MNNREWLKNILADEFNIQDMDENDYLPRKLTARDLLHLYLMIYENFGEQIPEDKLMSYQKCNDWIQAKSGW